MTARPPVLRQDLVDRLRARVTGGQAGGGQPSLPARAARRIGRPLRRVVVRVVDPSLQATLDQLRHEAAVLDPRGGPGLHPEVEVLRAELASTHGAIVALSRRLDELERALSERGAGP